MTSSSGDKYVVVYDGHCHFCIEQIERIKNMDTLNQFEYLSRHDPNAETRFPILRSADFDSGMRLIDPQGKVYVGADGIYQIARRLPTSKWFAWLYCVPGINQIAKVVYAWVAANRKRLGRTCDDGSCEIHPD